MPDKVQHFVGSAAMAFVGSAVLEPKHAGYACAVVGTGKEFLSSIRGIGTYSTRDILANFAGCAVGAYSGDKVFIEPLPKGALIGFRFKIN
jgi:uncharacterized protein YfiM (DUF2279 family)